MPYWRLHYHFVWSTKGRQALIGAQVEAVIYDLIRRKAVGLGASVFALNGVADHVHLVAAVPPRLSVATFVGQVKGSASARYHQAVPRETPPLYWQDEYGVFSFDAKRLPNYVAYVENQKAHHARGDLLPALERTSEVTLTFVQESQAFYGHDAAWWREMAELGRDNVQV